MLPTVTCSLMNRYSRQQIEEFVHEASAAACKYIPRPINMNELNSVIINCSNRYYMWTDAYLHDALQHIGGLSGKRVVVVGSLTPWYESVALAAGAESVTTIEYNKLDYDHPRISTVTNAEWYGGRRRA